MSRENPCISQVLSPGRQLVISGNGFDQLKINIPEEN
jgi:hypothetical protein